VYALVFWSSSALEWAYELRLRRRKVCESGYASESAMGSGSASIQPAAWDG
jgi:hypothetical protein